VLEAEARSRAKTELLSCRSELAREKPENAALNQDAIVIVNDLREQARSHIWTVPGFGFAVAVAFASPHSSRPVGRCALDLLLILILGAPLNHAGRSEGTPSPSEVPSGGKSVLLTFALFKSEPL
jgi:hypothetical protein